MTYEQSLEKWRRVHSNKSALKAEILSTNGSKVGEVGRKEGTSEEFLSRIPDRFLALMRPLSPEDLRLIAEIELKKIKADFKKRTALNPGIILSWDEEILKTIQEYDYIAEDNARPVQGRVRSFVKEPLVAFLRAEKTKLHSGSQIRLSIKTNEDGTKSLKIEILDPSSKVIGTYDQPISYTLKDRIADPISDEEIDAFLNVENQINESVFNVNDVTQRIADRMLAIANNRALNDQQPKPASTIVLMGLSSTGKTELSKAVSKVFMKNEGEALVVDFSQVQTLHDFKARILGLRAGDGTSLASDFIKHYDRNGGDMVVVFDELANVKDMDLLKALYDFFREPVVRTFADGVERSMTKVKVIVTGNSGIEQYANVPRNIPMEQQMAAWHSIHVQMVKDPEARRAILERQFPEPLINRWGLNNVFFVAPHTYKSLKQLAQLKFSKLVRELKPSAGRRGWNLGFSSKEKYSELMEAIVDRGFNLREQGSSIDLYIRDDLRAPLEALLLKNKVPSGTRVLLEIQNGTLFVASEALNQHWAMGLPRSRGKADKEQALQRSKTDQLLTAYHEIGHALASRILLKGIRRPSLISIIPGVARIGEEWVVYAGVAMDRFTSNSKGTREEVVRVIAQLAAGETAQRLVTKGEVHDFGKGNDMKRATALAEKAILIGGLSEKWGTEAVPSTTNIEGYIARMSEKKKALFEQEVRKLLAEGRALARDILEANMISIVIPMAKELAAKGVLKEAEINRYFDSPDVVEAEESHHSAKVFEWKNWVRHRLSFFTRRSEKRDGAFKDPMFASSDVVDVQKKSETEKKAQYDLVEAPDAVEIFEDFELNIALPGPVEEDPEISCEELLM
ncbi:MAG TPA: hypothetical protein DCL41_05805 [Bdellovibrionales bacterium]|nr:hypothetical protein [Pseudobdellovibrionaceae bacterium]HAG91364.1 hypothetical protein [Bdellovibrionales bacterium]